MAHGYLICLAISGLMGQSIGELGSQLKLTEEEAMGEVISDDIWAQQPIDSTEQGPIARKGPPHSRANDVDVGITRGGAVDWQPPHVMTVVSRGSPAQVDDGDGPLETRGSPPGFTVAFESELVSIPLRFCAILRGRGWVPDKGADGLEEAPKLHT
ncbi:hypothetical protein Salat_1668400 [Sesamum alatum]|uniref:Uncharacterized protein n=1 Tax=Sesamum alatum TaxID=300844 RepID=A0AAE1Y6S6_9LAMI|nr:hypothetical protein Salat_1668400 [Sesamum alatum]